MSAIKYLTIGLAVALAIVLSYSIYFYFGPIQQITDENKKLTDEITRLRKAAEESEAGYRSALEEKTRRVDDLEKALSEVQQEKTTTRAGLQDQIRGLKDRLSQQEQNINTARSEIENLQQTITDLKSNREYLNLKSADLSNQLLESKNQLEGLHQQVAVKEKKLAEMTEARRELIRQVDLLKEEKEILGRKAMGLENQLRQSREQLNSLSQEVAAKENQLKTIAETQEKLEKQLQQQIQEKDLQISALKDKLRIQLLDKILFNPGNAVITARGRDVLKNLATELKKLQDIRLVVEGHTDNQPLSEESRTVYHDNLGLSVARAASVARTMRILGVDPELLSAAGYSMHRPIASNETAEGRQLNRRVEIILMPDR